MLRVSRMADYAVLLATYIGRHENDLHSSAGLSRATGIPAPTVSKLLKHLARDNILISQRGILGGYSLARPTKLISVAEIIVSIDGPIAMTDCLSADKDCDLQKSCNVKEPWKKISDAINSTLTELSLENIIQGNNLKDFAHTYTGAKGKI